MVELTNYCFYSDLPSPMAYLDVTIDIPEGELNLNHIDRIIEMAWEDRTPFEAIKLQFGLNEAEVKTLMKSQLKFRSYTLWRERVECCKTKHLKRRLNKVSRFKSKQQRNISSNKISKKDNG